MSFDDYAHHIYQKYRLCIAIAILKTKPPDLNVTDYIERLKSNMADKMDVDDVTICSDDFNMSDDDSVAILDDFENIGDDNVAMNRNDLLQMPSNFPKDPTQSHSSSQSQPLPIISQANINEITSYNYNNSQQFNINQNIPNNAKSNITNDIEAKISKNLTVILPKDTINDSQKTVLYTVPVFSQNYTHYSASQTNINIPTNHLYAANRYKDVNSERNVTKPEETNNKDNINDIYSQNDIFNDEKLDDNNLNKQNDNNVLSKNIKTSKYIDKENTNSQNLNELFSQNNTNTENTSKYQNKNTEIDVSKKHSQSLDEYFNEIRHLNTTNEILRHNFGAENEELITDINEICPMIPNYYQVNNVAKETTNLNVTEINEIDPNTTNFVQNNDNFEDVNINLKAKIQEICPNTQNFTQNSLNFDTTTSLNAKVSKREAKNLENFNADVKFSQQNDDLDIEEAKEVIPYKVLEELNKIKMFLRRRDRRMSSDHSDSGYRSDSQRSLKRSLVQSTGMTMNESAYCLLNHIVQTPLKQATEDITMEIAQTLGHLINRLHEDEIYPPFLEEMLDTVDILLRQVYKGQSSEHNEFLKKEDFLQRILLLNTSIHIQRHTIEKISNILSKFHEKITDENDMFEITNINEIENASFIFHILELIIKKYIKNKNDIQTSSQLSQNDERVLKKSSITDIWRKKWNPNLKEKNNEGRSEKVCVLKNCSEILNKIVVDCVNSFSLVSYAALKCFNAIQS